MIQVETWLQIAKKLMPGGRIMVNCGGADFEESLSSSWVQNPTVKALCSAFPGQVWHNWPAIFIFTLQLPKLFIFNCYYLVLEYFQAKILNYQVICACYFVRISYVHISSPSIFCTDYHLSSASNVMDTIYLWVVSY